MVYIIQYDKENVALQLTGHQLMQNKKNDVQPNSGWINELNWLNHIVSDNYVKQKSTKVPFAVF